MKISNKVEEIIENQGYYDVVTDNGKLRVIFMTDEIVRIRCTFDEEFSEEASYTLVMTAWEDRMDKLFKGERRRIQSYIPKKEETEQYVLLKSDKLKVYIYKEPFGIDIYDFKGNLLHSDLKEKSYVKDKLGRVFHYSRMNDDDYFYGFGEKTGYLNKAKKRLRMNNVDTLGYDAEYTDPLYKHIPFYVRLNKENKIACGLFYHNSYESIFDMGCERSGYWNKYSYFSADGGDIDLFFIYGPEISNVVKGYTDLTGKTVMPPLYSLGYMGSTMYYTELPSHADEAVLNFVDRAKKEGIPCDGFHLSSGYTTGEDGKRYVHNWNKKRFKNPKEFFKRMSEKGVSVSPNVKPGMLLSHPLYNEYEKNGAYILDSKGEKPHTDRYWGGKASFVDFTNEKGRDTWKKYLKESLIDLGVTAIWNDNNEYEINDQEAVCDFEGKKAPVAAVRPNLPNMMAFVAQQAVKERYPDVRPYVLNRAGFAGIQRYAQTWAGDNNTSWKSLKFNVATMLGMGLSGVANQGCDIGGFYGPAPEAELFVRWVQNGIFQPRFSIHSCNTDNTVTEPWMYPSYTKYIREAVKLRYSLVPYLYSFMHEAATAGSPIMRPLVYEFQEDVNVYEESFDFMFGKNILVANILEKDSKIREVYLPKGSGWYDWHTREKYEGGQRISVETSIGKIPLFIRSGAIIPMAESIENLHLETIDKLHILVEPSDGSQFCLYEDDGVSNNYLKGEQLETLIKVEKSNSKANISFNGEGSYITKVKDICIEVICDKLAPSQIIIAGRELGMYLDKEQWDSSVEGWYFDNELRSAKIKYQNPAGDYSVLVNFGAKDLISI